MASYDTPTSTNADVLWAGLSAKQQLANINRAIRILQDGGQSYSLNGRSFQRPMLETYYKEKRQLEQDVAESESGGLIALARFGSAN